MFVFPLAVLQRAGVDKASDNAEQLGSHLEQ
jgi:hypothetical protein